MSTLRSASYALGVLAFAGVCAVCAIGGPKSAALGAPARLLFVSDPKANTITIFSLPGLKFKGTLAGLSRPHGLCADHSTGYIWATNTGTQQILEYNRAGSVVQTLSDSSGKPTSCSVDEVAVGNVINTSPSPSPSPMSGPGETYVYVGGVPGKSIDVPGMYYVNGIAYQDAPNLYMAGRTKGGVFVLGELPAGSTTPQVITVTGGTINFPGMVQWDPTDNYLAVGDRQCGTPRTTCVYLISISGSSGTIKRQITFDAYNGHVICDMAQGVIGGSGKNMYLAGGDNEVGGDVEPACKYAKTSVYRWAFPAGGMPIEHNTSKAPAHPFGTAISSK